MKDTEAVRRHDMAHPPQVPQEAEVVPGISWQMGLRVADERPRPDQTGSREQEQRAQVGPEPPQRANSRRAPRRIRRDWPRLSVAPAQNSTTRQCGGHHHRRITHRGYSSRRSVKALSLPSGAPQAASAT